MRYLYTKDGCNQAEIAAERPGLSLVAGGSRAGGALAGATRLSVLQSPAMNRRHLLGATLAGAWPALAAEPPAQARPDWGPLFEAAGVPGTLVVHDARGGAGRTLQFDAARAARRLSPASTFKIPHSLFALDAGLVRDEFQVFAWDGVQRPIAAWNRDQTLRSAMRDSVVWVFEGFADALGPQREAAYLQRLGYGNGQVGGDRPFWVEGDLAISAHEQVALLRALHRNALPFAEAHQRLVKDVMVAAADSRWILRAKSGWTGRIGWWVGWIEFADGPVCFALNIDTPRRQADLPARMAIVRDALRTLDAWPAGCTV